jgi:hypothetical protein
LEIGILRLVLTKGFFANFGIISGFMTVGITCRLRISGLGPVSARYHVIPFLAPVKKGIT